MSVKKFRFVSPAIKVAEVDNSALPKVSPKVGPIVIGRAERGPSLRPVTVQSFSEWVEIFGNPIAGGKGGDVWRDGNYTAPTYGAYAAQAWLKNNAPLTFVRLLGAQHTNATSAGNAGWECQDSSGNANGLGTTDASGGAYGLFIIDSGSSDVFAGPDANPATGALAAVFYINEGSITLTGSARSDDAAVTTSGSAVLVQNVGSDKEFRAVIRNASGTVVKTTTFNFNINSRKYIRRVFNTNPTITNSDIALGANTASYWLGQTYERHLDTLVTGTTAGSNYGVILGLKGNGATLEGHSHRMGSIPAQTGWFFSQDLQSVTGAANSYQPENMTKLFKFHCHSTGEWTQKNVKVSIQDIKASTNADNPYGSFSIVLRKANDSDNAVRIVEQFTNCNLNPNSVDYVARKVGDRYKTWSDTERLFREYGNYENNSKFLRIEMNGDVDAGAIDPELLPFGVFGPIRHRGFSILGGDDAFQTFGQSTAAADDFTGAFVQGSSNICRGAALATDVVNVGLQGSNESYTGSFRFPTLQIRSSSADGNLANPTDAFFGVDSSRSTATTRFDSGYSDYLRAMPSGYSAFDLASTTEYSWIFTLDDLRQSGVHAEYNSGSRADGLSMTAISSDNYKGVLDSGFDRFTAPLYGGFDGLKIDEKEPFNNTDLEGGTETTNYAFNSVKRAIDSVKDPEVVESNIMVAPGITNEGLTSHVLNVCEDRADSLCIMDLKGGFIPSTENTSGDSAAGNRGDVDTTITNLRNRGINSSYGCAYYPWVQVRDTVNNAVLWAPPSIVALGTMGSSEQKSELWFAPAGFTRGGLTEGSAGIPVVGVRERLTSAQRDKLYEANINPIATFPNEGIVIWGQKTLQVTPSALDRINVRRMLIFLKKEISRMAAVILFDPNVRVTWNRFLSKAEPFLRSVKTRLGLVDYKIVLDETTTTPDLIDRNIMYAKIFLKPAKAIEYIGIDFNITDQGAAFVD